MGLVEFFTRRASSVFSYPSEEATLRAFRAASPKAAPRGAAPGGGPSNRGPRWWGPAPPPPHLRQNRRRQRGAGQRDLGRRRESTAYFTAGERRKIAAHARVVSCFGRGAHALPHPRRRGKGWRTAEPSATNRKRRVARVQSRCYRGSVGSVEVFGARGTCCR